MFKIYGTDRSNQVVTQETCNLVTALRITREMRDSGYTYVTMASENPLQVGKLEVDAIVDGKTPDVPTIAPVA